MPQPDRSLLAWRLHDPGNPHSSGELAWRDGSTFLAEHDRDPGDFFRRHPSFVQQESEVLPDGASATRVWLAHYGPPEDVEAPRLPDRLERPYDLLLHGYLDAGADNFAVHPDVAALEYMWCDGDGPFLDTWCAKIWLKARD